MARHTPDSRQEGLKLPQVENPVPLSARLEAVRFQTPSRDAMYLMGMPLKAYLEKCGEGWVVKVCELLESVDCSALVKSYGTAGQPPLHPRLVLGLLVYGFVKGMTSLRDIERLARVDVGAMYLCGGLQPDHSTLGRFVLRHAAVLTDEFFVTLTGSLMKKLGRKAGAVAADGTVVEAAASRFRIVKAEAAKKAAEAVIEDARSAPDDEPAQKDARGAELLKEQAIQRQAAREANNKSGDACLATTEPEAVVQPRKDGPFRPSYKPSVLATKDRLIVGQHVHPSNEVTSLKQTLMHHQQITGEAPSRVLLDAGFLVPEVLQYSVENNIDTLCPSGRESSPQMRKATARLSKEEFTYDEQLDAYRCPQGKLLVLVNESKATQPYRRYRCNECDGCPRRAECTDAATGRTIKRVPADDLKEAMQQVMKQPRAREAYRQRKAMVEPVFSVLRDRQDLRRFRRRGLAKVAAEFAVHCIAYNLRCAARCLVRWRSRYLRTILKGAWHVVVMAFAWAAGGRDDYSVGRSASGPGVPWGGMNLAA